VGLAQEDLADEPIFDADAADAAGLDGGEPGTSIERREQLEGARPFLHPPVSKRALAFSRTQTFFIRNPITVSNNKFDLFARIALYRSSTA
jgi:hypothetical protein